MDVLKEGKRKELLEILDKECCWSHADGQNRCSKVGRCVETLNDTSLYCPHMIKFILPLHTELIADGETVVVDKYRKKCKCGRSFETTVKNKTKCDTCVKLNKREKDRLRQEKKRSECHESK